MLSRFIHNAVRSVPASTNLPHAPVMTKEVLQYLKPESNQVLVDMTFGAGGHSRQILEMCPNVKIIAVDRDPEALKYAETMNVTPALGKFSEMPQVFKNLGIHQNSIDGILFDFGCSSMQFDYAERGFSLSKDGPLDMRMNQTSNEPTASDVLAKLNESDLYRIFKVYGEEKQAKRVARAIVETRHTLKRIETTKELANIVAACFDDPYKLDKLQRPSHSATKIFQALRIFVNNELNEINYGMVFASKILKIGGRLVTLTFHSLEDTIVKRHISGNVIDEVANSLPLKYSSYHLTHDKKTVDPFMQSCWKPLNKHVVTPKFEEIENNPRCRSAKLRAAVRIS